MTHAHALFLTHGGHARLPNNQPLLEDVLTRQAGLNLTIDDDYAELTPERLRAYDLIVNYSGYRGSREPTDQQIGALTAAVYAGTPYIALHVATLTWKNQLEYYQRLGHWPDKPAPNELLTETQLRYLEMTGSAFVTHGPIEPFTLEITDPAHPITQGIAAFEVEDELYQLGGDRSRLHVLAEAGGQPLLYVTQWGAGNVHYNALGHDQRALSHPTYQCLLVQAVAWALDIRPQAASTPY